MVHKNGKKYNFTSKKYEFIESSSEYQNQSTNIIKMAALHEVDELTQAKGFDNEVFPFQG